MPSKIGELKNLKYLNLNGCLNLWMLPHEISKLTSLSTQSSWLTPTLSVEAEALANVWSLKGLKNLTGLFVQYWNQN